MKLTHPETGHVVHVGPTGAETMRARGYVDDPAAGGRQQSPSDEAPAKSASRAEWDEHARTLGLDPEEYSSKDDLIDAIG